MASCNHVEKKAFRDQPEHRNCADSLARNLVSAGAATKGSPRGWAALRALTGISPPLRWLLLFAVTLQIIDGFDLIALSFAGRSISVQWGLSPARLGVVFSAAPLGSMFGAVAVGVAAGRIGRKTLLIVAALIVGVGSLATVWTSSFTDLLILRAITGVGLGAALPLLVAFTAEFSPATIRGTTSAIVVSAQLFGMMIAGAIAANLIPAFGWRSIFLVGSAGLILVPALATLPSSLTDLARRGGELERIQALYRRYGVVDSELSEPGRGGSRDTATRAGYALPFLAMCSSVGLGSLVGYFLFSWVPTLLQTSGLSLRDAALCSSFISAGAIVGVLFHGRLMDRWSAYLVIGAGSLIAMVLLATLTLVPPTPLLMFGFCFLVGAATLGSILANFAFANLMFPSGARMGMSAVVTWLGRLAGLVAPIGAGVILAAGGTATTLYLMASGFLLAAALSMLIPGLIRLRGSSTSSARLDNDEDAKGWRRED